VAAIHSRTCRVAAFAVSADKSTWSTGQPRRRAFLSRQPRTAGKRTVRDDERRIRIAHVSFRAFGRIACLGFCQTSVSALDLPILGRPISRYPAANVQAVLDRDIERRAIGSSLPA
jgi:hypothetical protein